MFTHSKIWPTIKNIHLCIYYYISVPSRFIYVHNTPLMVIYRL